MARRNIIPLLWIGVLLLTLGVAQPVNPAMAASNALTGGEVLASVNELRRSHGLQPYSVDPVITAYAQEHSEFQALTDVSTHLHSDGVVSLAHGLVENVAGGDVGYLTAQTIVYEIWADPVHMKTMIGYESGSAGVGVASNSTTTFVTLNVRPGGASSKTAPGGTFGSNVGTTPIALVPLTTATMRPDGAVIHEVGYGQSLWAIAIAYNVPGARIRELNGMAPGDSAIWAGQKLVIIPAGWVTPTQPAQKPIPINTASSADIHLTLEPTLIVRNTISTQTSIQVETVSTSPVYDGAVSSISIDPILAGLVGLSTLGLLLILTSGIRISRGK